MRCEPTQKRRRNSSQLSTKKGQQVLSFSLGRVSHDNRQFNNSTMPQNYGSTEDDTERSYGSARNAEDPTDYFDADDTYYLKEGGGSSGPTSQRLKKLLVTAFPIIIAALIVGGAVFYLLNDFGHLYPGRSGDPTHGGYKSSTTTTSSSNAVDDFAPEPTQTKSTTKSTTTKSTAAAACSAHDSCSGLEGNCCPTDDGKNLDCCN